MRRNEIASIQEPHCRLGRFVLPRFWTRFVRMTAVPRLRLPSLAWTVSSQFSAATGSMYWRIRVLNRALVSQASLRSNSHANEIGRAPLRVGVSPDVEILAGAVQ